MSNCFMRLRRTDQESVRSSLREPERSFFCRAWAASFGVVAE